MGIPIDLQVTAGVAGIASIAGLLLLLAVMRQLLHGRVRAAARTAAATGVLAAVAFTAALLLGLTPLTEVIPPP
ncbi:hypothetical protein [Microbacterium trichothecenolyticum]|uniref:Uncharacterized protein n=1 Tax=Microbacterium trichothecenolyticum TaxID=69370 RepID=A0A0M2HMW5_MICTR|nr:hypothetical protein [Microbacterium trichothecenolyticum]KJL45772.1 hypothetical protein RS82_00052 [Microbacterium trichothecenolyticum]